MTVLRPYFNYSETQHITAVNLLKKKSELIDLLFPVAEDKNLQIATMIIMASGGSYTLLLGDVLSFADIRNCCEPLIEVCPVLFEHTPRHCSEELFQAVQDHGEQIPGSPRLVALQFDPYSPNLISKFLGGCSHTNPHQEMARVVKGEILVGYIGNYKIRRIQNGWQPSDSNPGWQGLKFEQTDRVIHTWFHEPNPQALQSARDKAQGLIDQAERDKTRKEAEIQAFKNRGMAVPEKKEKELEEINAILKIRRNHLAFLTAKTVNSAAKTTLQCALTMKIDQKEKLQLLDRYICQAIVNAVDRSVARVSWQTLTIRMVTIENFIKQKIKILEEKVEVLIKNQTEQMTDWEDFKEETLLEKSRELRETFADFCLRKSGKNNPTDSALQKLEQDWKTELGNKLSWVTSRLRMADDQLNRIEHHAFTEIDIKIFDADFDHMTSVLKKGDAMTYALAEELAQRKNELNELRIAIKARKSILLIKRLTDEGKFVFGTAICPDNPEERPDPNSQLNEVHIPVLNIKNSLKRASRRITLPQYHSNRWKWIGGGIAVIIMIAIMGIWRKIQYKNEID
ncbi:MAG: hypothetical protein JSS10_04190 [Verrucomicrobia bacterium]|nr:hypothetical protein [Verrucomicrobiota bacterium]